MNKIEKISLYVLLAACLLVGLIGLKKSAPLGAYVDSGQVSRFTDMNITNDLIVDGNSTIGNATLGGSIATLSTSSATYTLSAANVCDSSEIQFTPLGAATTVTFPATSTLFASCLTSVGQFKLIDWNSISTSTVLVAGAGGTLGYSASSTVAAGKYGFVKILRDTTNTYKLLLVNIAN